MIDVLLSIDIILQVHLSLVVHLVVNVLQQEAAYKTDACECQRSKGSNLQSMGDSPLEGGRSSGSNFVSLGSS